MPQKKILFLDKVFTKPLKSDRLRGVEIFNVFFVKDLVKLDHQVTLIVHPSWQALFDREISHSANLTVLPSSRIGGRNLGSLAPLWAIRKHRFDALFLANAGDGILIPYKFIKKHRMAAKTTLLSHKEPGVRFVKHLQRDTNVVSLNRTISKYFDGRGFAVSDIYYGILNAEQFYPRETPRGDGKIRIGMLGDLDSDWKGSGTAIDAFLQLPPEFGETAELHLAAFTKKIPRINDPRIIIHDWKAQNELGDYLRSLDIMLNLSQPTSRDPSHSSETFCQSMVQGMLCGLPQIATSLDIFTEKLDAGGGLVVKDQSELIEAMLKLGSKTDMRIQYGKIAGQTARERYVWNSNYFIEKYM